MKLTLHRDHPVASTSTTLPAETYNLARTLVARSPQGYVFVPVRSLQYLAVLDREEFAFVDSRYPNLVAISWRSFRPQARTSLDGAVPYRCLLYRADDAADVQRRLPVEFAGALRALAAKAPPTGPGHVLSFRPERPPA